MTSNLDLATDLEKIDQQGLVFRELPRADGTPGRTIAFADVNIQPLDYACLARAKLHEKLTIPFEWRNSRIVGSDVENLDKTALFSVTSTLESTFTSRAIGLVKGGWLPSALAATRSSATVLLDRNLIPYIVGRFKSDRRVDTEPDFIDLFADRPVLINPLLFAIEGNAKVIPTPELVRNQLEEVVPKLRAALPSAKLVVGPQSLQGALGIIEDTRRGFVHKMKFLAHVAPRLAAPVCGKNIRARWNEVLAAADECAVPRKSLVVFAALSSIAVPNGRSPAKRLLNLKASYREEDAYNALADLRSLEILIHALALFPDIQTQLCTADRDLALFWTGIQASSFGPIGRGVTFDLSPVEELLPASMIDEWRSWVGIGADESGRSEMEHGPTQARHGKAKD